MTWKHWAVLAVATSTAYLSGSGVWTGIMAVITAGLIRHADHPFGPTYADFVDDCPEARARRALALGGGRRG